MGKNRRTAEKFRWRFFCLLSGGLALLFVLGPDVWANRYQATKRSFERSLMSLKETVEEFQEKNAWLRRENDSLRNKIRFLEERRQELKGQSERAETSVRILQKDLDVEKERINLADKEYRRLRRQIDQLAAEEGELERSLHLIEADEGRVQKRIQTLKKNISEMRKRLSLLASRPDPKEAYKERKQNLTRALKDAETEVRDAQKALDKFSHKYPAPLALIEKLSLQQRKLTKQLDREKAALKVLREGNKALERQLGNSKDLSQEKRVLLKKEIEGLKKRKEKQNATLEKVEAKIKERNILLPPPGEKMPESHLAANLEKMKKENKRLKEELSSLEKTLAAQTSPSP